MGILVLLLILKEMLSVFTIEYDICCGFSRYGLYYVKVVSFESLCLVTDACVSSEMASGDLFSFFK